MFLYFLAHVDIERRNSFEFSRRDKTIKKDRVRLVFQHDRSMFLSFCLSASHFQELHPLKIEKITVFWIISYFLKFFVLAIVTIVNVSCTLVLRSEFFKIINRLVLCTRSKSKSFDASLVYFFPRHFLAFFEPSFSFGKYNESPRIVFNIFAWGIKKQKKNRCILEEELKESSEIARMNRSDISS